MLACILLHPGLGLGPGYAGLHPQGRKEGKGVCKRKEGRPKRRWSECTTEDLNSIGAVGAEVQGRMSWRKRVEFAPGTQPRETAHRRRLYKSWLEVQSVLHLLTF